MGVKGLQLITSSSQMFDGVDGWPFKWFKV